MTFLGYFVGSSSEFKVHFRWPLGKPELVTGPLQDIPVAGAFQLYVPGQVAAIS